MQKIVFLSSSSKDRKITSTICKALENRGHKCWMSSRDVPPGQNFQEAIVRAIRGAGVMVLVFSSNANNSDEIKKEIALAGQSKLMVIPVRTEDVAPSEAFSYELSTRQWVDLFDNWERAIDQLLRQVDYAIPPEFRDPEAVSKTPARSRSPIRRSGSTPTADEPARPVEASRPQPAASVPPSVEPAPLSVTPAVAEHSRKEAEKPAEPIRAAPVAPETLVKQPVITPAVVEMPLPAHPHKSVEKPAEPIKAAPVVPEAPAKQPAIAPVVAETLAHPYEPVEKAAEPVKAAPAAPETLVKQPVITPAVVEVPLPAHPHKSVEKSAEPIKAAPVAPELSVKQPVIVPAVVEVPLPAHPHKSVEKSAEPIKAAPVVPEAPAKQPAIAPVVAETLAHPYKPFEKPAEPVKAAPVAPELSVKQPVIVPVVVGTPLPAHMHKPVEKPAEPVKAAPVVPEATVKQPVVAETPIPAHAHKPVEKPAEPVKAAPVAPEPPVKQPVITPVVPEPPAHAYKQAGKPAEPIKPAPVPLVLPKAVPDKVAAQAVPDRAAGATLSASPLKAAHAASSTRSHAVPVVDRRPLWIGAAVVVLLGVFGAALLLWPRPSPPPPPTNVPDQIVASVPSHAQQSQPAPSPRPSAPAQQAASPAVTPATRAAERAVWDSVKSSKDAAQIQSYLDRYPSGRFARLAHARLATLKMLGPTPPAIITPPKLAAQTPPVQAHKTELPQKLASAAPSKPVPAQKLPAHKAMIPPPAEPPDNAAEADAQAPAPPTKTAADMTDDEIKAAYAGAWQFDGDPFQGWTPAASGWKSFQIKMTGDKLQVIGRFPAPGSGVDTYHFASGHIDGDKITMVFECDYILGSARVTLEAKLTDPTHLNGTTGNFEKDGTRYPTGPISWVASKQ